MTAEEHARILYLVDALTVAPEKSARLFYIAQLPGASDEYVRAIQKLERTPTDQYRSVGGQMKIEIS